MDFIKIPQIHGDKTVTDVMLRVSQIQGAYVLGEDTQIVFQDNSEIKTPMSVAKLYDLIWQTELSNESHSALCATRGIKAAKDVASDLGFTLFKKDDLMECRNLLRLSIIGNSNYQRLERVLKHIENALFNGK